MTAQTTPRPAADAARRWLIVTAVEAERAAVESGFAAAGWPASTPRAERPIPSIVVIAGGVGVAAAAASTARLLASATRPFDAVLCAGIGGAVAGRAEIATTVVAARSIAADLGVRSPHGFHPIDKLGFGTSAMDCDVALRRELCAALPHAVVGDVLTVTTGTGTADVTADLIARYPAAVAEAMEGFGAATAAAQAAVPFAEIRTISNFIGPRDLTTWRIDAALRALTEAARAIGASWPV